MCNSLESQFALTERQSDILKYIDQRTRVGTPPTFQDIADTFGLSGPSAVQCHIKALRRKGYLMKPNGKARTIRLSKQARAIPIAGQVDASGSVKWNA